MQPTEKSSYWTEKLEEEQQFLSEASYIIYKEEDTGMIYARNGSTGNIDYSGTDAATVIQNAIDALSDGGKIFIRKGEYIINDTIYLDDNIVFQGEGYDTKLKLASNTQKNILFANGNGNNVIIADMQFDGNRANNTEGSTDYYQNNIKISYVKNVVIERVYSHDAIFHGLFVAGSGTERVIVRSSFFYNNGYRGIHSHTDAKYLVFEGNMVYDNGKISESNELSGLFVVFQGNENVIVSNNIIRDEKIAVEISGYYGASNVAKKAIFSSNIVQGVTVVSSSIDDIELSNNLFSSYGDNWNRLIVFYPGYTFNRWLIIGNIFLSSNHAIHAYDSSHAVTFNNFTISDNIFYNMTRNTIICNNMYNSIISGNNIYYNSSDGQYTCIYIADGDNNIIVNNRLHLAGNPGIKINSGTNNVVSSNNIDNASTYIFVSSGNVLSNNVGFTTENSGSATISNGNTSVTVNHGLAGTPTTITLTGGHSEVKDAYATNVGSTSFDITVDSAVTADRTVYWSAEYKP